MTFLKNLRLPVKLYTSAALIIGLIAVMALSSWSAFQDIGRTFRSVRGTVELSTLAQTAQFQMANAGYGNLGVSKAQTAGDLAAYEAASAKARAAALKSIGAAVTAADGAGNRELLAAMQAKVAEYSRLSDQGLTLRHDYLAATGALAQSEPALDKAVNAALDQALERKLPLLSGPLLTAQRHLASARGAMKRFLLTNAEADAKQQKISLATAWAAIDVASKAAKGTSLDDALTGVAAAMTGYGAAAKAVMDIAESSNGLWYGQARAVREAMNAATEKAVDHLLSAGRTDIAAAVASITAASSLLAAVAALVLVVVIALNTMTVFLVARPIVAVTGVMDRLAHGDNAVEVPYRGQTDEVGGIAQAVQVFKENALRLEQMTAEQEAHKAQAEAEKKRAMNELADAMEASVKGIAESVSAAATQMHDTAAALSGIAQETSAQATSVAAATEQATNNVETVASAAEELSSSIQEIGRQVTAASGIAASAVQQTEKTNGLVSDLAQAAS
ncbi:MAG: hypothetical protein AB7D00_09255, partial [Rhodospirillaceae bacterium]